MKSDSLTSEKYDKLITLPASDFADTIKLTVKQTKRLTKIGLDEREINDALESIQEAAYEAVKECIKKAVFARINSSDRYHEN
jgi:Holliday junction resolvasome RuvABC DNA-binding subunit